MRKKRVIQWAACLMALVLCVGCLPMGSAFAAGISDFKDLSADEWYGESVSYVLSEGLFQGMNNAEFAPNESMTRGMFVTVLGRMAGVDPDDWCDGTINDSYVRFRATASLGGQILRVFSKGESVTILGKSGSWYKVCCGLQTGYVHEDYVTPKYKNFSDVSYALYYAGYIIWAYENGYVDGVGGSAFEPDAAITREQICKILYGYASSNGYEIPATEQTLSFADEGKIQSWAADAVAAMQRGGVVNGYEDGSFRPNQLATRAEVAKMIHKFLSVAEKPSAPEQDSDEQPQKPAQTPVVSDDNGGESSETESATPETEPEFDPADESRDTVSTVSNRLRVGLYPSSRIDFNSQAASVTLTNNSGNFFDYGSMAENRSFTREGEISASTIVITTDGTKYTVTDARGTVLLERVGTQLAIHPLGEHTTTSVSGTASGNKIPTLYSYYGDFNCLNSYRSAKMITLVNYVDVEDYVKGVLPYEFSASWPEETLKAAAIAIRSYAMAYTESSAYSDFGFDLVDGQTCQVYSGCRWTYAAADAAVDATANMYLTYSDKICYCMYCSSNGGAVKAGNYAYLVAKDDPYDAEYSGGYGGHGIGMSQWGAYIMGKNHDMSWLDILGFYYPGTTVKYGV